MVALLGAGCDGASGSAGTDVAPVVDGWADAAGDVAPPDTGGPADTPAVPDLAAVSDAEAPPADLAGGDAVVDVPGPDAAADVSDAPVEVTAAALVGTWLEPPFYRAAMRFDGDGTARVAASVAGLDSAPFAVATWTLDGVRLTFVNSDGVCAGDPAKETGVYDLAMTREDVTFTRVADDCSERNVIDGEVWIRHHD